METDLVKKLLGNLNALVNTTSNKLNQNILDNTLNEKIEEIHKLGELENDQIKSELKEAKILNIYSYILVSLYFTNLKLSGEKLNNDSLIMNEIKRVKEFMDKVKKAEELMSQDAESNKLNETTSKSVINRYLNNGSGHEPAVSKAHFQNSHVRFNNEEEREEDEGAKNKGNTEIKKVADKLKRDNDKKAHIKTLKNNLKNNKNESRKISKSSKVSKEQPRKKK